MTNILILPDSHADPTQPNDRFDWFGNMILERAPDIVVNIGDLANLNSLSSYDKGKKSAELRRYRSDIDCVHDALMRINKPLEDYNRQRKNIRKGQRKIPRKEEFDGNHEYRIIRAIDNSPELAGTLSLDDLKYREFGWNTHPFKCSAEIEGVWFCHYYPSGVKGEPISGFNIAQSLISRNMVSSVCGHSHLFDYAIRSRPDGTKVIGLCVGCYVEDKTFDDATDQLWWSGIIELKNVKNGTFDLEQFSIERVKQLYG